jgi:lysophospholipase L1-like esterase
MMKLKLIRMMLMVLAVLMTGNLNLQAKKVHTLGDSTMAPYDESATNTRGWGMYFGNFLTNGWTSVNYAKGGRDSRGGYNELWQNAKNNVEAGDYVLIQFAHNDGKYNGVDNLELQAYYTAQGDATNAAAVKSDGRGTTPSTTYKACLKQIVDAVKEKGATPILVSAVCRCYFNGGTITKAGQHNLADKYDAIVDGVLKTSQKLATDDHSMDYSYQMKQLATEIGVAFIDMTTATKDLYESYGTYDKCYAALFDKGAETDNTHYNLTGALTAARLCAQLMKQQGILADNIVIPTDLSFNPSTADMGDVYVGQSATKELTLSGLGLDPATGTVTVTATDGIQLSTDKQNWQSSLSVNYENGTLIKTFYAKVNITAAGAFNGTITATIGSKSVDAAVTVNGIELGGGDPFTATWALTANDNAVVSGNATAAAAKVEGMVKYGNNSQKGLMVSTSDGGTWVKAEDDSPNQYVQFSVTAPDGKKLDINHIAMKVGGHGGGGMRCHVYYSTDGFVTRTTIYSPASMTSGVMNEVDVTPVIKLEEGDQLQIRVYPWYTGNATGKWLCVSDVVVGGQSKDAAGVNISGTITYTLDKGGLAQNDDAVVMNPNELSAGFAAKRWSYDGTNDKVVIEGTTFYGASGDTPMMQLRYNAATSETLSTVADDDCTVTLTLTPEDGFSFVPSNVSFLAGKFNSGNPHLTFAVEAGEKKETLKDNVDLNRSKTNPRVDPSTFSEELTGYTATADNPLKLHFSFLNVQGTRSAGIANVVVTGTLVGAAAQVTKYALNTQVLPSAEAGSISRDPDMEQYKEGTQVTLKATKNFGYQFKEWQDGDGKSVSTDATTTVTMDSEKTMKAVFEAVPVYTIITKVTNDADRDLGSITLTPNEHSGKYEAGTKVTAVANETKILKFTNWEDNSTVATREITVDKDMTITANYEVQDFIAVFDASTTSAYATQGSYPFAADVTWDANRNAKVSVVKQSDGSQVTGTNATPVVRNRANSGVLTTLSGVFQNGYNTAEIAWQYQFSTVGFIAATFTADMAAKNAATKSWKAQISTDGTTFADLGSAWEVTANVSTPLSFELPTTAIGKETVYVRIMGTGSDLLSTTYAFDKGTSAEGLAYTDHSESQVGNVYVLGEAVVEKDETAPIVTSTVPADGATGVSASGKITISYNEKIEAAEGTTATAAATLTVAGGSPANMTPAWSTRSVSFDYSGLEYGKQYTFVLPANYVQDKSGNKDAQEHRIVFTVMDRPTISKGAYDAVVSTTAELSAAIAEANSRSDKNTRYRIFVKKGTYKLPTGATKHYKHTNSDGSTVYWEGDLPDPITYIKAANISFIGEDRDATIITQDITNDADMLFTGQFGTAHKYEEIKNSAVLQLESAATGTYFQDITIKSGINDALGRNLAILDNSSKTIYKNSLLYGYQDTWTSNNQNGLYYFEDGQVRGRTDYLCGSGDAYFKGLELLQVASGYAAVPSVPKSIGWVFKDCTFSASGDGVNGTYTLGRPWGKGTPVAVFIDTKMNVTPKAEGWNEMSGGWPKRFAEYNSTTASGAAVDLSSRKTVFADTHENNPVLTAEEAATYSDMNAMFGDWQPTLATEQAPVPANVAADGAVLTWDNSDYALLWAVCKDGDIIAFTGEPTYTATEAGTYTIRAANEMGGLSPVSEAVEVTASIITPAKQYTTYVTTAALDFSNVSGLKAYVATSTTTTSVTLKEVGAVPSETPLLLIAETTDQAYTIPTASSATAPQVNLLKAGDGTTVIGGSSRYDYVLKDGEFRRAAEGTVDKGKAYLHLESLPSNAAALTISIEGTTGISEVQDSGFKVQGSEAFYNLSGQRVAQPAKGLYIVNGRKVVMK